MSGRVIEMSHGSAPKANGRASEIEMMASNLSMANQMARELSCIFAAHLRSKHNGKAFIPQKIAEECYGDPDAPNGWMVASKLIPELKTFKVQVMQPDATPWIPPAPVKVGTARQWLGERQQRGDLPILSQCSPELLDAFASILEDFRGAELTPALAVAAKEEAPNEPSAKMCGSDWHKHPVGLRCPECGSKAVEELVSA